MTEHRALLPAGEVKFAVFRRRARTVEALVALAVARGLVGSIPFKAISRLVGSVQAITDDALSTARHKDPTPTGALVGRSLSSAASRLPWHSSCLVRAIAGGLMLRRRGVESIVVLGVTRSESALLAHAWLIAEDQIVCGGREFFAYLPIAVLRRGGGRNRAL